jgi:hypothetical protein
MTLGDRVAILAFLAWALFALVAPWVARWHERRRGIAPPARWPRWDPEAQRRRDEIERARQDLLLPFGCGCCGQDCPEGDTWCLACRPHVGTTGPLPERTYYSLHGVDCPYAAKPIEETRLMPGAEHDVVPEGLGFVRPPRVYRAHPSRTTPLELLPVRERELWRDALKAGL